MVAPFIATIVSGALLLAAGFFFRHERMREARYAHEKRARFDRLLFETKERAVYRYGAVHGRSVRQSLHFIFHQFLTLLIALFGRIQRALQFIVYLNKRKANTGSKRVVSNTSSDSASQTHLSAVADHKRSASLSETEKQRRRSKALNTQ